MPPCTLHQDALEEVEAMQHGYGYVYQYRTDTDTPFFEKTRYVDTFFLLFLQKIKDIKIIAADRYVWMISRLLQSFHT